MQLPPVCSASDGGDRTYSLGNDSLRISRTDHRSGNAGSILEEDILTLLNKGVILFTDLFRRKTRHEYKTRI